ncbi:MAG: efflux RND transporter periplasmic adaptor subunit [Rhodospirillaceae bacterium]|nr:efflux RND transporter periplasmic adaptor subunit [Rhodospirillaceae bacterium]
MKRWVIGFVVALALTGGAGVYFASPGQGSLPTFRMQKAEEGEVIAAISASGTLAAVITVQVSSQLSGQIKELYADFNTEVKQGDPLALIDPQTFEARLQQAKAELDVARASLTKSKADLGNVQAALAVAEANTRRAQVQAQDAEREKERKTSLSGRGVFSQRDTDKAISDAEAADAALKAMKAQETAQRAAVGASEAGIATAEASVRMREATLAQAQIDLDRTVLRTPVNGVVIQRNIDRGQTVAVSLSAPVMFSMAQDLKDMEVYANVDEADVGRITQGLRATFTVDAFSGRTFEGQVKMVRKGPQVISNVVTYVAVISASNPDLRLLPGMTATVRIVTAERPRALKVPNAALRYRPPGTSTESGEAGDASVASVPSPEVMTQRLTQQLKLSPDQQKQVHQIFDDARQRAQAARARAQAGGAGEGAGAGAPADRENIARIRQQAAAEVRRQVAAVLTAEQRTAYETAMRRVEASETRPGRVWVLGADGRPQSVAVRIGIGDGSFTEVVSGEIKAGQEVIVGHSSKAAGAGGPRWGL